MLTPITIKTYNKLLSKEKPLIEIFFYIGSSLTTSDGNFINNYIVSLANYTNINEANLHIKQIQDFYNASIETFDALDDETLGYQCDAVIDALLALENLETTKEALYSASLNMLSVLVQEYHLEAAMHSIAYNDVVKQVEKIFDNYPRLSETFLELFGINTMLRKGADADDVEDFTYKMYVSCQLFNRYRKAHLKKPKILNIEDKEKGYGSNVKKLFTLDKKISWNKNYSYVENIGITKADTQELLVLANDLDIYDYDEYTDENENIFYAITHAFKALSELKVLEAKPIFLKLVLNETEDNDWISENFPLMYSVYGDHEEAFSYIMDESLDEYLRWAFVNTLALMYKKELITREVLISYINKALVSVEDDTVNAALVCECMEYKLKETYLSIVHVFAKDNIKYDICGDLADVEIKLGII